MCIRDSLYIELMGKYANIILVDEDGRIVDALKRIPPFENSKRTILPGAVFTLPEPHSNKQDPYHHGPFDAEESFSKQFHGFSPLLSKEVQYRMHKGEAFDDIDVYKRQVMHSYRCEYVVFLLHP